MPNFKYRQRVLIYLFFLSIITYLDRVCIGLAGTSIQADLGIDNKRWGWVIGAFTLSYMLFEIPAGALGDRIGPRKVLTRIVVWWSVFTSLTGFVWNLPSMLVTRFLFGVGEAGAFPNCASSISRWFPKVERARAHSIVWMASRVGGALAPFLVIPIQAKWGWRASFMVFGIVGITWALLWYWWYRDHPSQKPEVTPEELAEIDTGTSPGAHTPLPWGIALRDGNLWKIMLMYHTYCWGGYFYLGWLSTYLRKGRGATESEMLWMAAMPFVAGIFGNLFGGWLSDRLIQSRGLRFGRLSVGATGLTLSALFMLLTALAPHKIYAVIFLTLGYGSMDCMLPVSWAVCLDVGRKYAGSVSGAMNMAGQVGSFASSVAFGYIVDYFGGNFNAPLFPMAALLLVSALLFLLIDPTKQLIPED